MDRFVQVEFASLTTDPKQTPVMVLKNPDYKQDVFIAVNSVDANRLAIATLNFLDKKINNLSGEIISSLGGTLDRVVLEFKKETVVTCYLQVILNDITTPIEARPGEGVLLAINQGAPIFVEKKLFHASEGSKVKPLKERIRETNTQNFAAYSLI